MVTNHLVIDPDLTIERSAFRHSMLSECEQAMLVFVFLVEYVDNLQLKLYVSFPIEFVLYVKYSNEYFSPFHNISIEHRVNDLHVYSLHVFHHLIHCNVDEIDRYFDSRLTKI